MKHALRMVGYGVGGLAVAAALSLGAFALAGSDISQPVQPIGFPAIEASPTTKPPVDHESGKPTHRASPRPSPSQADDHSGTGSGGSTSTSGSSESSGSGTGDASPSGTDSGSGEGERGDSGPGGDD